MAHPESIGAGPVDDLLGQIDVVTGAAEADLGREVPAEDLSDLLGSDEQLPPPITPHQLRPTAHLDRPYHGGRPGASFALRFSGIEE